MTACIADIWYRYHRTDMSGTTAPLRAVPYDRYNGTIGAIFSPITIMSDYPMLISNKLHSFRNFDIQIYEKSDKKTNNLTFFIYNIIAVR